MSINEKMLLNENDISAVAERLAQLYEEPFAGKSAGRYRISSKLIRRLLQRRRLVRRRHSDADTIPV